MTVDALATYLAAGRAMSPWIDHAVAFVCWTAPGVILVGLVLAATCLASAVGRAIRSLRKARHTVRAAELYLRHPELRAAFDDRDQPMREEL